MEGVTVYVASRKEFKLDFKNTFKNSLLAKVLWFSSGDVASMYNIP